MHEVWVTEPACWQHAKLDLVPNGNALAVTASGTNPLYIRKGEREEKLQKNSEQESGMLRDGDMLLLVNKRALALGPAAQFRGDECAYTCELHYD